MNGVRGIRLVFLTFILFFAGVCFVAAQGNSYIYVQGDKVTPFYVRVNGMMAPRYSKNYCIVPALEKGTYIIEILFEQNKYTPIGYSIDVPDNGERGFLLYKSDTGYELYDLVSRTYLNKIREK